MTVPATLERQMDLFSKSRKREETRSYFRFIVYYLLTQYETENIEGWIQSTKLKEALVKPDKIPNSSSFFYLLGDMESFGLIEKCSPPKKVPKKGRATVYYRIPKPFFIKLSGAIKSESHPSGDLNIDRISEIKLFIAYNLLKKHGVKNPEAVVEAEFKKKHRKD